MNENPITTRCPACNTAFHVTTGQLKIADGLVRCGNCLNVFTAEQFIDRQQTNKSHTIEINAVDHSTTKVSDKGTSAVTLPPECPQQLPLPPGRPPRKRTQQFTNTHTQQRFILPENSIELTEETISNNPLSAFLSYLFIITLVFICAAQIFWFQQNEWIQKDNFKPIYQTFYKLIDQPLPTIKASKLIMVKQLVIQPHDEFADAIRLSILLENTANFAQPFPSLQLLFTDIKGHLTAQRTLPPPEYINTSLFPQQLMPSKQPIQIQLDMMSPGLRAVSYQLNLISD